ncbi:hypothetical protein KFX46_07955 [Macrococcus canis]|uniref:hypothetical protein n=1 Tax=Macrococcoides canis TaxID=1855823 RepID=UPI00207C9C30|nr:hypothetical protein [Macrococcus canis]MCO4096939.1 hypothetical protein [Macrococcus canis]
MTNEKHSYFLVVFRHGGTNFTYNFKNMTIDEAKAAFSYGEAYQAHQLNEDGSIGEVIWRKGEETDEKRDTKVAG